MQSTVKPQLFDRGQETSKKWYEKTAKVSKRALVERRISKRGQNISFYEDVAPAIAKDLRKLVNRNAKGVNKFMVLCKFVAVINQEPIEFEYPFYAHDLKGIQGLDYYIPFCQIALYAGYADQLTRLGFVSSGSAQYVKRLPENRGVAREDWTKRGMEWGGMIDKVFHKKADMEIFDLPAMDYKITQIQVKG